jgi:hypothetical protein
MKNSAVLAGRSVSALVGLILLAEITVAQLITPRAPGIWRNTETTHQLTAAHEEQLIISLRRITGLNNLHFTPDGALALGEVTDTTSGSAAARRIIANALNSGFVFIIENHSGSSSVNFGQLDEGTNYEDVSTQLRLLIWRVRLDFDDFARMQASPEVRASFNVGFTILHELLHGLGYTDAKDADELGDCERLVNESRAELALPLRDQYFGEPFQITPRIIGLRLRFREDRAALAPASMLPRPQKQYLFFLLPPGYEGRAGLRDVVRLVRRH